MTNDDEAMIGLEDVPGGQACLLGARRWAADHNLKDEFVRFLQGEKFPVSVLRATGCPLAEKVCQHAVARHLAEKDAN